MASYGGVMVRQLRHNDASAASDITETPYAKAVTGFKNYWYPAIPDRLLGSKPKRMVLLGEPIALIKRRNKVYAIQDECPHRGARMSLAKNEFPDAETLSCRFHGWTFDLATGSCVAALTEGPESNVVGKVRIRTFPVEQRKGLVFIWMGRGKPVPLEEDIPALILAPDARIKVRFRQVFGNWRQHAEGSAGGHFFMLHRDSIALLYHQLGAYNAVSLAQLQEHDPVDKRPYLLETNADYVWQGEYPSLGNWPPRRPWRISRPPRRRGTRGTSTVVQGIKHIGISLPGFLRVPHFPQNNAVYYEWYIAIDSHHYHYMQISAHFPRNFIQRIWGAFWYNIWAGPIRKGRFNNQDKGVVRDGTEFEDRMGVHKPTPLYKPDVFPLMWIQMCNEYARGEGWKVSGKTSSQNTQILENTIPVYEEKDDSTFSVS